MVELADATRVGLVSADLPGVSPTDLSNDIVTIFHTVHVPTAKSESAVAASSWSRRPRIPHIQRVSGSKAAHLVSQKQEITKFGNGWNKYYNRRSVT